jgi:Ca2+-binding EF-hand superfamily protein
MMNHRTSRLLFIVLLSLAASGPAIAEGDWQQFDIDKNNELNLQEFTQLRITQYTLLDRNSDGQWTRREFVQRAPDMTLGRIDALRGKFKRWDKNADGLWDTSEAAQSIEGNFKWLDKNRDGSLAPKEFPKVF